MARRAEQMKGISACGDCSFYSWKIDKCLRGCKDEGSAQDHFYKDCPLPDVVERKRGHWVIPVPGDGEPCCSECKKEALTVGAFNMHSELTDFCPHCGADMREADNG